MNIGTHIENVDRHEAVGFHRKNLNKLDSIITNTSNINVNTDTLEDKLTNGNAIVKAMGSESGATDGTQRQIHLDGSGNVLASIVSSVNVAPANSVNAELTPTQSFNVKNDNITKGADLTLTEAQQNLVYGIDAFNTSQLEPIRISSDKVMVESFIASVASGISNSMPTKEMRDYGTLTTLDASLSVPNGGNNDSSIVSNNKLTDEYIVQVQCDDNTYTDFNAEVYESIDASNFKSTFQLSQGMTPSFFLFERIEKLAPNWKIRINNTGASTKTFTIKYIKAD